uniref:(northern house mosquito) hypothetical protein n=1 Tax=Culex pipiens TaxID=7175 RepID=A0A8D8FE56_CULPI
MMIRPTLIGPCGLQKHFEFLVRSYLLLRTGIFILLTEDLYQDITTLISSNSSCLSQLITSMIGTRIASINSKSVEVEQNALTCSWMHALARLTSLYSCNKSNK